MTDVKLIRCRVLLLLAVASLLQACGVSQTAYHGTCGKTPNLELTSLAMYRDPLPEARKIDEWRAIIRSDSSDVCQTTLNIADAETKKVISLETKIDLTLGANEVPLYSIDDYRLSGNQVCFEVNAYINGAQAPLDSPRPFCARTIEKGWWSMR
jgi:hypothetical protein